MTLRQLLNATYSLFVEGLDKDEIREFDRELAGSTLMSREEVGFLEVMRALGRDTGPPAERQQERAPAPARPVEQPSENVAGLMAAFNLPSAGS